MRYFIGSMLLLLCTQRAPAQHKHQMADMPLADTGRKAKSGQDHHMPMSMPHAYSLSLPMSRNGSGTSWNPDGTPVYAYMKHAGDWSFMLHGNVFLRYSRVNFNNDERRGGARFDAPNWLMGMAQRRLGPNGLLHVTAMISLDRLTLGGGGYPLLFQSGESWKGLPLTDRQHPHDLFSALSVGYTQRLNRDMDLTAYLGYPGEPALGPVAFMHRLSALSDPDAPIGHHWQDATHIVFGVGTLGFRYRWLKAEGSIFTGREPDENRYNFDKPLFDSYSWRLSANPVPHLALQVSQGYIKSPEALHPGENIVRTTASAIYNQPLAQGASWNSTLVWGMNDPNDGRNEHSMLLESNYIFHRNMLYGRYEWIRKSAEELGLEEELGHDHIAPVQALTLGYSRTLLAFAATDLALGGQLTACLHRAELDAWYGPMPLSAELYLRITPSLMGR